MRPSLFAIPFALYACADSSPRPQTPPSSGALSSTANPTLDEDLAFLRAHGPIDVLEGPNGGRVAVSARWQGRVMTSAVQPHGASLGFVNRRFIESGATGTAFDNYGGEDRFWLGPEAGQYGLYFAPGAPFVIGAWQTPHELQEGEWEVKARDPSRMTLRRNIHVLNWSGTAFDVAVERTVRVLDADRVRVRFGELPPPMAKWVAFETENRITNIGQRSWTPASGLISTWILGMYRPAPDARVIVPFDPMAVGPVVNDAYFGKVPPERLTVHEREGWLALVADGAFRSKLGLSPSRARGSLGSYCPSAHLLTVVRYSKPATWPNGYVNSMWRWQEDALSGDVVNAYNDGPPEPGKASLGGFYELETSSPAAALAPGESIEHVHATLHVEADAASLEPFTDRVLGVSLTQVAAGGAP